MHKGSFSRPDREGWGKAHYLINGGGKEKPKGGGPSQMISVVLRPRKTG